MKRAIVTGSTSFIGVHLIELLLRGGYEVWAVVRPHSANSKRLPEHPHLHTVFLALNQMGELCHANIGDADVFFHLAWEGARVPYRDDAQLQHDNYIGTLSALQAAVDLGCHCFVGAGSQAEYGTFHGPVSEQHATNPVTEYGKQKLCSYMECQKRAAASNIRLVWPRIFSIYGPYDYAGTLIMSSIPKMRNDEPIQLTPCTQKWDYLHVQDAAKALLMLFESQAQGVYNIASGSAIPLLQYIQDMKRILHSQSELQFGAIPYGENGPVSFEPEVKKLMRDTGWYPTVTFEAGILELAKGMH